MRKDSSIYIQGLIFSAIILSWLGIKPIPAIAWLLIFLAVIVNIISANIAMGFYGYIYITSGFLGLILNSKLGPGYFFKELNSVIIDNWKKAETLRKTVKNDINELKKKSSK